MGFFTFKHKTVNEDLKGVSLEFLHKHQCGVCPLREEHGRLKHPDMKAYGSDRPAIYMIGEAPGADEDRQGRPFVGKAGRVLQSRIPEKWQSKLRWNNVVRTKPPSNRTPNIIEIECCRPSIIADIEATKPPVIFGFGNVPLEWATGLSGGVTRWSGRRMPIRVGTHTCWFYSMLHPSYVMRKDNARGEVDLDIEFQFTKDLERAFAEVALGLPPPVVHTAEDAMRDVAWVTGENGDDDVDAIVEYLDNLDDDVVGFDYETNGIRPYATGAAIQTVGLSSHEHGSFAFPLHHREARWSDKQLDRIEGALEDFFHESLCRKAVHNLAFELEWAGYFYGRSALRAQPWDCTMSQAFVLDARQGVLSLEALGIQYFGINIKQLNPVNRANIANLPLSEILPYNAVDAKYHLLLFEVQSDRLKDDGLWNVYQEHLRRLPTFVLTQLKGIPIDQKRVTSFAKGFTNTLQEIEQDIAELPVVHKFRKLTGSSFRPSSNDDVRYVVNNLLGRDVAVESVDKEVLGGIKHRFVELILEYRENAKLLSTYVEPLIPGAPDVHPDGRLHPLLQSVRVVTWRTSSDSPNIQNFPKREHRELRRVIAPGGDMRIVSFDYAGIQARNVAMESKDETLVRYFWERYDIHTDWMERIIKASPKWLPKNADKDTVKKYRNIAKNGLVFPSFFGAQKKKIAMVLGVTEDVAARLHEQFWHEFPDIKKWHNRIKTFYGKNGYVTGLTGFRRRAPVSPNEMINAPIQADEALIVCDAMCRLSEMQDHRVQANLMVHDDLTFILHKDEVDKYAEIIIKAMLDCPFKWVHIVPLGVEMMVGKNWGQQEVIGEFYSDQDKLIVEYSE